jgi:hypothetical protein
MKLRFQADADFNEIIIRAVQRREPAVDFQTARSAVAPGLTDAEVLALAADASRVLVTHDRRTMPRYFAAFIATRRSGGVIVVPQNLAVSEAADQLVLIWSLMEADEFVDRIVCLPL